MRVVVGRVGRAHGLGGDVAIALRTDDPEHRFQVGAVVYPSVEPGGRGQYPAALEVVGRRWHSGRLLVRFAQCPDRSSVEALAGLTLEAEVDVTAPGEDPEEFHDLALIGLAAALPDGSPLGGVIGVVHLPGQDLLEILRAGEDAEPLLVPFVRALVPTVDVQRGLVVVDLPAGFLDQWGGAGQPSAGQSGQDTTAAGHRGAGPEGRRHGNAESPG